MAPGRVLVIAGSDSSGGAGLEADQKVLAAHGCYAMTATTALTVQNTLGVRNIHVIPAAFVEQQIDACIEDVGVDVVKTGMLAAAETIEMVAKMVDKHGITKIVVDPVMASTSGSTLLPEEAIEQLVKHLLPRTYVLTPNMPEAGLILAHHGGAAPEVRSVDDLEAMARRIQALGPRWVLLKGGHLPFTDAMLVSPAAEQNRIVVDVLVGPEDQVLRVQSPWQDSSSTHGTGCSLASAIAAGLAKGDDVPTAVRAACRYIEAAIRTAPQLGHGHGPLNHFHSTYSLPFSPGYFLEYLHAREDVSAQWQRYITHPFVMAMGDGTLPLESFKSYIIQDYQFLIQFARANALAAYKATSIEDIASSAMVVDTIMQEIKLHVNYCKTFDIPLSDLQSADEHQACTAYTRYVLDIGQSQDWLALQVALAPCLFGYADIAKMLLAHPDTQKTDNVYWQWIETYASEEYMKGVRILSELLEKHIQAQSPSRVQELVRIFIHATKMEIGFWEMFPCKL
ncbi:Phosphomethylpyrimidine kinase-domain-containing protein [Stachybotrys elegans]|uniref:Phosphomethylpyrimidine kinase-domain-containing protein n=1 Tax=Stachybotrys elegans TaxID=80388 RepID=A0A8K0WKT6_9HYPO|nr:Phosphomethylpyrimidine kinase-domain-containing protein [Stachybotrys elegans]